MVWSGTSPAAPGPSIQLWVGPPSTSHTKLTFPQIFFKIKYRFMCFFPSQQFLYPGLNEPPPGPPLAPSRAPYEPGPLHRIRLCSPGDVPAPKMWYSNLNLDTWAFILASVIGSSAEQPSNSVGGRENDRKKEQNDSSCPRSHDLPFQG